MGWIFSSVVSSINCHDITNTADVVSKIFMLDGPCSARLSTKSDALECSVANSDSPNPIVRAEVFCCSD